MPALASYTLAYLGAFQLGRDASIGSPPFEDDDRPRRDSGLCFQASLFAESSIRSIPIGVIPSYESS